ncbi:MAG: hypothetical protein IPG55_02145 [Saprospiraceae bacterium]|nr:hypothetical protein [Candidatus Defluviibacterium haderslevense]
MNALKDNIEFAEIEASDLDTISYLAQEIDGNPRLSKAFIKHWYFENPTSSYTFWKVTINGQLQGFATINHYHFWVNHKRLLIGMPQNEYIAISSRGKGYFRELYWKTEEISLDKYNVQYLFAFPNKRSAPIFEQKFGYKKCDNPVIILSLFSLSNFFSKQTYKILDHVSLIQKLQFTQLDYALDKSMDYLLWRYKCYTKKEFRILEIEDRGELLGYAFLKPIKKYGFSFMILMDLITIDRKHFPQMIKHCKRYCSQQLFLGLLRIQINDEPSTSLFEFSFKQKLNFMIKSKSLAEDISLDETKFQFFFGDLDIF